MAKKKIEEEKKVKLVEVWPLHKLEQHSAPKGAFKKQIEIVFTGFTPEKIKETWAQTHVWNETLIDCNEALLKHIISIAKEGEAKGLVVFAGTTVARRLAKREEAVYGAVKASGTTEDGTHIWSSSLPELKDKMMAIGGTWSAGVSKYSVKGNEVTVECWFHGGKDFYVKVEDSRIARITKPYIEETETE